MTTVLAYFMHEEEKAAALSRLRGAIETEGYIYGEIDDADIEYLKAQGIVVQILEDAPAIETPGFDPLPRGGMRMRLRRLLEPFARVVKDQIDESTPNYYLIDLAGPLLPDWGDQLAHLGVEPLEHVPQSAYTAHLTPNQARSVGELRFVRSVTIYSAEDTAPREPPRRRAAGREANMPREMLTYDVLLHRAEDLDNFVVWLDEQGVDIAGSGGRRARIYLIEDSSLYNEVRQRPEVQSIEPYVAPTLHNDLARQLLGVDPGPDSNPGHAVIQTGEGQIVAVADTGLDDQHPDFRGRITGIVALGREYAYDDPHGHGTHVSGSAVGDGAASGGEIKGTAPEAKLFFQSLLGQDRKLKLPFSLADLFQAAYDAGARIHNNSWGSATNSRYTASSQEVDQFVHDHPDMLLVFSAGNDGQAAERFNSEAGFTDWLSIGSPASAKNVLTVGASRSSRHTGGYSAKTFGDIWKKSFPDPPIANEVVSGNPEGLAAFSSRGPCDDHRIKPDLVAPGTNILSTRSPLADTWRYWGLHANPNYAYWGGTSMSAPLVAGCAALVREFYQKEESHDPSAALLKATLINSGRWLSAPDAIAAPEGIPNFHQGFGCLFMPWCIPNPGNPWMVLKFMDTWLDTGLHFTKSGQALRRRVSVGQGEWLRFCLTYTDRSARARQNKLNLTVEYEATRQKWLGNADLPLNLHKPDPDNNVEVVRLENPQPGDYLIKISATDIFPNDKQAFALVVTGGLTTELVQA